MKLGMCLPDSDWDILASKISEIIGNNRLLKLEYSIQFSFNGDDFEVSRHDTMELGPDVVEVVQTKSNGETKLYWITSDQELYTIVNNTEYHQEPKMTMAQALVRNYQDNNGVINKHQIDDAVYDDWVKTITAIYRCCRQLYSASWGSFSEMSGEPEYIELFEKAGKAIGMIGDVNGFPIRLDNSFGLLLVAYVSTPMSEEDVHEAKPRENSIVFRLRLERYFARKIMEQLLKSPKMLIDDNEDCRIARRLRTKRRRQYKRRLEAAAKAKKSAESIVKIGFTSFVVRCYAFRCNKNHTVEPVRALVDVMLPTGTIIRKEVLAGYCRECKTYFMFDSDYRRLREEGVLLCQVVSQTRYESGALSIINNSKLKPESLLHQSGYNVSSVENLTDIQRQEILKRVIDNSLYSQTELIGFFDWLIKRNAKQVKKDMSSALHKWKIDREFVSKYKSDHHRDVRVDKIIR